MQVPKNQIASLVFMESRYTKHHPPRVDRRFLSHYFTKNRFTIFPEDICNFCGSTNFAISEKVWVLALGEYVAPEGTVESSSKAEFSFKDQGLPAHRGALFHKMKHVLFQNSFI